MSSKKILFLVGDFAEDYERRKSSPPPM